MQKDALELLLARQRRSDTQEGHNAQNNQQPFVVLPQTSFHTPLQQALANLYAATAQQTNESLATTIADIAVIQSLPHGKTYEIAYFEGQARMLNPKLNTPLAYALKQFQTGRKITTFGTQELAKFTKQDVDVAQGELERYALQYDIQLDQSDYGNHFKTNYFDTKLNFCLTYDGELIASVGADAQSGRLYIGQIQGKLGKKENLKSFHWYRAIVQHIINFAQEHNIPQVAIMSADNNKWVQKPNHLEYVKGKILYDGTARKCGLTLRDDDGDYVINLLSANTK